jgi:hypothetical protein
MAACLPFNRAPGRRGKLISAFVAGHRLFEMLVFLFCLAWPDIPTRSGSRHAARLRRRRPAFGRRHERAAASRAGDAEQLHPLAGWTASVGARDRDVRAFSSRPRWLFLR